MSKGDTGKVSKQPTWARQEGAILDALSPVILRERVEDRILGLPNVDAWSQALGIAAAERESMKIVLTNWRSHSRQTLKCS